MTWKARRRPLESPADQAAGVRRGPWTGFVFTGVAGFVDAVGYLALRHVFTANMSGNSIAIGSEMAAGDWQRVWERGLPVPAFFLGLLFGGALMELARLWNIRSVFSVALSIEGTSLGAFVASYWILGDSPATLKTPWVFALLVSLAAFAMGVQNASLTKMGSLTIHTTHVTGTLTRLAEEIVAFGFCCYARRRGRFRQRAAKAFRVGMRREAVREALGLAGLWIGYVTGAAGGTLAWVHLGFLAMAVPTAVVLLMAIADPDRLSRT